MELVKIIENEIVINDDVRKKLKKYNEVKLQFDLLEQELKRDLMEEMKKYDIKKWENDLFVATYIQPTTRNTLDSKRLKEELPDIFEEYQKESKIKESLRLKYND